MKVLQGIVDAIFQVLGTAALLTAGTLGAAYYFGYLSIASFNLGKHIVNITFVW